MLPDIGTRDYPADSPLIPQSDLAGIFTDIVEILKTERLLIPADLEDRIGGCINNHLVMIDLVLRIFIKDDGAAGGCIADHFTPALLLKKLNKFRGKSCIRKCDERLCCMDTHHLPVTRHRILATALLRHPACISERSPGWLYAGKRLYIGDSHRDEIRDQECPHSLGNMT